jgi:putative hydrolase of the HAD superfamily
MVALLLDALGTLVRLDPPAPRLRAELAARFGLEIDEDVAAAALLAEIRFYRAHLDEGRDVASLHALRRMCAEVLRGALPASERLAAVGTEELTAALLAALRFTAFADARPAIAAARSRGLRVVVASNWDVSLHEVLGRLELLPLLDGVVTSAEVGARKPAPAVFHRALELAGASPTGAVHVGDSVEEDVAGARAAGVEPILLSRDGRPGPNGVRRIASLDELKALAP